MEGGSEVPPGGLLDWEGERWTDDNGGEARVWESPQGDLHPATRWLRLSAPSWGLHRFGKVIPSRSPPSAPLPLTRLSPLPPIVDTQAGGDELARRVRTSEGAINTVITLDFLWRSHPNLATVALVATDTIYHWGVWTWFNLLTIEGWFVGWHSGIFFVIVCFGCCLWSLSHDWNAVLDTLLQQITMVFVSH